MNSIDQLIEAQRKREEEAKKGPEFQIHQFNVGDKITFKLYSAHEIPLQITWKKVEAEVFSKFNHRGIDGLGVEYQGKGIGVRMDEVLNHIPIIKGGNNQLSLL